jgi:hypothetical protein
MDGQACERTTPFLGDLKLTQESAPDRKTSQTAKVYGFSIATHCTRPQGIAPISKPN